MFYQWHNVPDSPQKAWVHKLNCLSRPERIRLLNCIVYGKSSSLPAEHLQEAGKSMLDEFSKFSDFEKKSIICFLQEHNKRHPGSELRKVFRA